MAKEVIHNNLSESHSTTFPLPHVSLVVKLPTARIFQLQMSHACIFQLRSLPGVQLRDIVANVITEINPLEEPIATSVHTCMVSGARGWDHRYND